MSLLRRSLVAPSLVAASLLASAAHAQAAEDSHQRALFFSIEGAVVPDPLSERCGYGKDLGLGSGPGAALLKRLRPWLLVQADARVVMEAWDLYGCAAKLRIVQIDSNTFEERPGPDYPSGTPRFPLATTALRVGVETPPYAPLLRATIGAGLALGSRPVPIGLATLGLGTRGNGKRFYMELEMNVARVKASERRTRRSSSPSGEPINLGTTVTPVVIHGSGGALRAGIEIPLARR